jgi:tryptophanase
LNSCEWPTVQRLPGVSNAVKYNACGGVAALQQFKKCRNITVDADVPLFMLDLGRSSENCRQVESRFTWSFGG